MSPSGIGLNHVAICYHDRETWLAEIAFLRGRGYVTPQDVKTIGMDVLRHRVAITYEAEAEEKTSETIIQKIFDELPVP